MYTHTWRTVQVVKHLTCVIQDLGIGWDIMTNDDGVVIRSSSYIFWFDGGIEAWHMSATQFVDADVVIVTISY